jgi:hypothetical protein
LIRTPLTTPITNILRCSFFTRRTKDTQPRRHEGNVCVCASESCIAGSHISWYRRITGRGVPCRTLQSYFLRFPGVQLHLLTVSNAKFSVLFIATRQVQIVCQRSHDGALFKPEHSISAHKWNNVHQLVFCSYCHFNVYIFGRHHYVRIVCM